MPSIKIGSFRLSIINESKPTNKYTYNSITQAEPPGLRARDEKIYELHLKGLTQKEIGKKVGITQVRVGRILIKKFKVYKNKPSDIRLETTEE